MKRPLSSILQVLSRAKLCKMPLSVSSLTAIFTLLFVFSQAKLSTQQLFAQKKQAQTAETLDKSAYSAMKWRNIGPFRGGRSVTATGVIGQPLVYYFGGVGSGVWKTEDAGISWKNISDNTFKSSSVGAITVAENDQNVIYVGMGEHPVRGVATSFGDGVYKSTDAGKTWVSLGLEKTLHIAEICVHPQNSDIVYVSAQGALHGASKDRGIYKSTDGGKSWKQTLYTDENTGAVDLSMDMNNPRVLYAAMWEHRRTPWQVQSGGAGCVIFKSTDGGDTWKKLSKGLPEKMGKIGVSVSRANSEVVYANIEAEGDKAGVYRSNDGGETWNQTSKDRTTVARSWYYMEIYADPQDAETVYVLNAPTLRSIDGGKTFTNLPTPHGDNHDLWINPKDNKNMINANDGGANVSFNYGKSWSTQQNQPTSQFYRVSVDNQFPYRVYGGQQDNTSVSILSKTDGSGITWKDWETSAGCESAYLAFDPDSPEIVYGGCYQGIIDAMDTKTGESKSIMAYPYLGLATQPKNVKYRFNWNAPILVSKHDKSTLYHAGNVLLKSSDKGMSWAEISPDLTRNEKDKQGNGGAPLTNEGAGGEVYNVIMYVFESQHEAGTIYVGTDDGLLHLTKDEGKTWQNITPPNLGEGIMNAIEVSPHDKATAYITFLKYKTNDYQPYIYKTTDYGKTWTKITKGIKENHFARVVREDPKRKDLLYAGTEHALYVSFDGGANWQDFQLNMPITPINDLVVHQNDLVTATSGRSFWILDDLTPLHQLNQEVAKAEMHLFKPRDTYKLNGGSGGSEGQNPPNGVMIFYHLKAKIDTTLTLEIIDPSGKLVRTYSSKKDVVVPNPMRMTGDPSLETSAGMNRMVWDLRTENQILVPDIFSPNSLAGYRVRPGKYTAKLKFMGKEMSQTFELLPDPRIKATAAQYEEQAKVLEQTYNALNEIHEGVNKMAKVKEQVKTISEMSESKPLKEEAEKLMKKINDLEGELIQRKQKTFQDVINFSNKLNADFAHLKDEVVDTNNPAVTEGAKKRLQDLNAIWQQRKTEMQKILTEDVQKFNDLYKQQSPNPVRVPEGR